MQRNRTSTLLLALALAFGGAQAAPAAAAAVQQTGTYQFQVGSVSVTALSDGTVALTPHTLLTNTTPAAVKARLAEHFHGDSVPVSVNAYLIELGARLVLVDAGAGDLFGPTLNKLPASLRAAGVAPEQITDILITHIHTDHTGGLSDGTRRVFANATLHLDKRELDYWMSNTRRAQAAGAAAKHFDDAQAKVGPYLAAGKVKPFTGASTVLPGIRSIPSPGHTPGHSFYALESGGQQLVFWGDLLHIEEVQMPQPGVTIAFDVDARAAAAARKKAFAEAAQGKYLIAASHIAFPGLGRLRADAQGYRFVPAAYQNDQATPTSSNQAAPRQSH